MEPTPYRGPADRLEPIFMETFSGGTGSHYSGTTRFAVSEFAGMPEGKETSRRYKYLGFLAESTRTVTKQPFREIYGGAVRPD